MGLAFLGSRCESDVDVTVGWVRSLRALEVGWEGDDVCVVLNGFGGDEC